MGDTLRDEDLGGREFVLDFLANPDLERFVSLSAGEGELALDVDDLRFLASVVGFNFDDDDSFCFLLVGGLCILVASTPFFRFLLVAVVEGSGRCPVTGSRFSLAALTGTLLLFDVACNGDNGVAATPTALGLTISGWGLSKKTVKLRADMMSNQTISQSK
jgi:hypothetical protein